MVLQKPENVSVLRCPSPSKFRVRETVYSSAKAWLIHKDSFKGLTSPPRSSCRKIARIFMRILVLWTLPFVFFFFLSHSTFHYASPSHYSFPLQREPILPLRYEFLQRFADRTDFIAKQVQEQGDIFNFTGFNNISGYPIPIVPNIIHFIRFNQPSLTLMEFICLRSALVRNADATVLIHSNTPMTGVHWKELIQDFGNSSSHPPRLQFVQKEIPQEIFNRKLTWIQHKSDVARLQILEKFGGIYLDNDVYVVHSLQPYLHFEFSIGWPSIGDQLLGNQILIGHKNSRFLQKYIATYKDYRGHLWYYNGGDLPTKAILIPFHELVHRVELKFGVHSLIPQVFASVWPYWHQYDTIHLLQNHREFTLDYMNNSDSSALRGDFSLKDLATSPYAFAEMSRDVWPVLRNRVPGSV